MTAPAVRDPGLAPRPVDHLARRVLRRRDGLAGVVILAFFTVLALIPDLLVGPLQTAVTATGGRLEPPSSAHPLGTDEIGRDMLNLTVHGTRISMVIGLLATVITIILGGVIGVVGGFVGGRTDGVLMRITDFFLVLPTFVLALILAPIIADVIGSSSVFLGIRTTLFVIVVVVGITSWASTARIIRAQTLSLKERPFVDRARVIGAGRRHIMARHILPNVVNLIVANAVLVFAGAVLTETTLSFVGLGDPFQPSWGQLLNAAEEVGAPSLGAWWYFVPPGACIVLVVFAFTLVGDGARRPPQPTPAGTPMSLPIPPSQRGDLAATESHTEPDELPGEAAISEEPDAAELAAKAIATYRIARPGAAVAAAQAGRPGCPAPRRRGPADALRAGIGLGQGGRRRVASDSITARRSGSPGNRAVARPRPPCRWCASCRANAQIVGGQRPADGHRSRAARSRDRAASLSLARDQHRVPGRDECPQPGPDDPRPDRRAHRGTPRRVTQGARANGPAICSSSSASRASAARRIPHELSGGMRQRAMIAMALACDPAIVIGDEPTTALDVMVQAQILELLEALRHKLGLSLILITHDLSVIAETCDRVMVMYAGRVAEEGPVDEVFRRPRHPYTQKLAVVVPEHPCRSADPRRHPRLAAGPAQPAAGLPVRAALLVRDGRVHARSCRRRRCSTASGWPATSTRPGQ